MPSICRNIVFFLSYFLEVQTYNLFYLDLLYLDNQQFLAILFDLFPCPIFFLAINFVWWFRLFQFLFLKSAQHLQEYFFFVSFLGGTNIYFILSCLVLLYLDNQQFLAFFFFFFFVQCFFRYLFFNLVDGFVCLEIFWNIFF